MRSYVRRYWLMISCAALLTGCVGSISDESVSSGDELLEAVPAEPPDEESLKVSVERVAGKLTVNIEFCFNATKPVPVDQITVAEVGPWRERCHASAKHEDYPKAISSWIYGDTSTFDLKRCEALERNRRYNVYVEAHKGCIGFEGSKRFEIREDGSIQMSGQSCFSRPYPRPEDPPSAP